MPRLPRLILPGQPHHVILRGNNRQAIFFSDLDRRQLLNLLGEVSKQHQVAVHAYVLMDNHLHLLATPGGDGGLSRMMQALGRRYVGWFNARHQRSGTLWEGRFRAGLIDSERYFLACMRYVELNPVRAGLCQQPQDWAWSSAAHHLGLSRDELLTEHELYWSLGNTPFEREHAYREFMAQGVPAVEREQFTEGALRGRPVGQLKSAAAIALAPGQAKVAERRPRGRPRKAAEVATASKA